MRMKRLIRVIAGLLFVAYFAYLLYRLFFFAYGQYFRFSENEIRYNLIPFKTIVSYIRGIENYKFEVWFLNLFGNIFAFYANGFLLPIIFKDLRSLKRIIMVLFLISSVLEMTQFWLRLGTADIDDVLLNTIGGLIGYFLLEINYKCLLTNTKNA